MDVVRRLWIYDWNFVTDATQNPAADGQSVDPGATMDLLGPKSWQFHKLNNGKGHVSCTVAKAPFADGTVWIAPTPAPAPTSTT